MTSDFPPDEASSPELQVEEMVGLARKTPSNTQGDALIIVLVLLVVITGMILAMFSNVTNERADTANEANSLAVHNLADSVVGIVIGQVRDATLGFARDTNGNMLTNSPLGWASQPGLIRTFDTNAATIISYKLYSASNNLFTSTVNVSADLPASGWSTSPAVYTDLNSPVISSGNTNYPIMDPYMTNTSNGVALVEGFSISTNATLTGASNAAAMPLLWLYVLRDGTIIPPDSTGGKIATFTNASTQPSSNNPIVARVAYWTDDETCKLNINTASEGSYWAQPSYSTSFDVQLGLFPPSAGEYNRYPGHPASTSLSPVLWSFYNLSHPGIFLSGFPAIAGGTGSYNAGTGSMTPTFSSNTVQTYMSNVLSTIAPRYAWGGSLAATRSDLTGGNGTNISSTASNRLFASVDEFFFAPTNAVGARAAAQTNFSSSTVAQLRFFLTTESRAPEVNPLNEPKLCLWPEPDSTHKMVANTNSLAAASNRTVTDATIAFCSTLGTNAYYFTRYDPTSATNDLTARNKTLYTYLRTSLNAPIPGFLGTFTSNNKWSGGSNSLQADQITTLLYDYIRSCINLCDSSSANLTNFVTNSFKYTYTAPPSITFTTNTNTAVVTAGLSMVNGTGQVTPILITNPDGNVTRGIGRFPTLRAGTLWFIARGANQPPLMCHTNGRPIIYDVTGTNQLSASDGSLSSNALATNVLLGLAFAKINTMHPWTCPQTANGLMVSQLVTNGYPVFADTNFPNTNSAATNKSLAQATDCASMYPIFDLSGTNSPATPLTRTYPTLDGTNGQYITTASTQLIQVTSTNSTNYYYLATNMVYGNPNFLTTNAMHPPYITNLIAASTNTSTIATHAGLEYLTVQRPNGATAGAFDIINPYYLDTNKLSPGQTRMEMAYLPDMVDVAPGQVGIKPSVIIGATGLTAFAADGTSFQYNSTNPQVNIASTGDNFNSFWLYDLGAQLVLQRNASQQIYTTNLIIVNNPTFSFSGGTITNTIQAYSNTVQTLAMNFPSATFPTPKLPPLVHEAEWANYPPIYATPGGYENTNLTPMGSYNGDLMDTMVLSFKKNDPLLRNGYTRFNIANCFEDDMQGYIFPAECECSENLTNDPSYPWQVAGLNRITSDTIRSVQLQYGDPRMISCLSNVPSSFYAPHTLYNYSSQIMVNGWPTYVRAAHSLRSGKLPLKGALFGTLYCTNTAYSSTSGNCFAYPFAVNTVPYIATTFVYLMGGISGLNLLTMTNMFGHAPDRGTNSYFSNEGQFSHPYASSDCDFTQLSFFNLWSAGGDFDAGFGFFSDGPFINKVDEGYGAQTGQAFTVNPYYSLAFDPPGQGMFSASRMLPSAAVFGSLPIGFSQLSNTMTPSTNILNNSWLTLQFSPNPNAMNTNGLSAKSALAGYNEAGGLITNPILPDHLLLDFFNMPVAEPYPISDTFSTAGKVNMNYQIVPFSYINRDAALRGVFKSVMITAVDDQWSYDYKLRSTNSYDDNPANYYADSTVRTAAVSYNTYGSNSGNFYFHYPIHAGETLKQFTQRFANNDIFRSPSEICALWLYPAQQPSTNSPLALTNALTNWDSANANIKAWWYNNPGGTRKSLTGDNVRERPYNFLYPRLTTKSNTYTVHYRVQVLQQLANSRSSATDWQSWNESTDKIVADQRGSATIERYIDPQDPTIPDFAGLVDTYGNSITPGSTALIMDRYYRFRVINSKIFTP